MPASSPSRAQTEAQRQARLLYRDLDEYRKILPQNDRFYGGGGVCRADGWNVSHQQLDGDFDLDEVLAQNLISGLANTSGPSLRNTPSSVARVATPPAGDTSWLTQYFFGDPAGEPGTSERVASELKNAVGGPGNVLGNATALKQAANAFVEDRTTAAIRAASRTIESGAAKVIKINQYMTLYNANKSGKGRPRPRLRIVGMPMQVVTPALGQGARIATAGANGSMRAAEALKAQKLGKLAADAHWTGKAAFLNGKIGGGVLTFAPSAALDVYNSVERDLNGDLRFNRNRFLIASAKSQSGNALGMAAGAVVLTAVAIAGGTVAAPVILFSLGIGIVVQAIWAGYGGADWAGSVAERALRP